jgi:DMSO/TMAO reductase YedYZ molybdopterin-dependent catalytic subunit
VSSSKIPAPLVTVPALAADQSFTTAGLTPIVVPNGSFYKIDTTLLVPRVDPATWKLDVTGMVAHPLTFTYDELLAMPLFEQYVTIACVSNKVGDHLVGNALWTGVRLKDVLESAGVQAGATQIVGRSVDGFTVGFPTSWAMAPGREPMIAVGMNREPLPADHGFPARLIVPGLYGYVSATKWLSEIQLTTREAVDGYWVPLGWAKDAPILTQSRIDVPAGGASVAAGPVIVGGVAWAPDRGIRAVEVKIDDGAWQAATISRPISNATWVQWTLPWTAPSGQHSIEVRATDDTGDVQTDQLSDPAPDGARGHHRIFVSVG